MLLFPWGSGALLASKRLSSILTRCPRSLVIGMQRSIKLLAHSRCSVEPWKAADIVGNILMAEFAAFLLTEFAAFLLTA